jgi:RHS repeat-associated protein
MAGTEKQPLVAPLQTIGKNGFLYVYVSNESPQDVYFDDLTVKHFTGPLQQEQSFYPFGLQMAAISSKALLKTNVPFKYNAGNELEEEGSLNYYNTFYRKYDAQLGRFTGIDIRAEESYGMSVYNYGANNPVLYNDPMGDKYKDHNGNTWHGPDPFAGTGLEGTNLNFSNWWEEDIGGGGSGSGSGSGGLTIGGRIWMRFLEIYNDGVGSDPNKLSNLSNVNGSSAVWRDLQHLTTDIFGALLLATTSIMNIEIQISNNLSWEEMIHGKDPGITKVNGTTGSISYNSELKNNTFDDAPTTSWLVLGHEIFHVLDLTSYINNFQNPLISHNKDAESLNDYYRAESSKMFNGNEFRLYFESRAVAYENLIRSQNKPELMPYRQFYSPFMNSTVFSNWVTQYIANFINGIKAL